MRPFALARRPRSVLIASNIIGAALVAAGSGTAAAQQAAPAREPFPGFDAYVNAALSAWNVPGVGIALVRNDTVIYAKGYGVKEVGKGAPVTASTIFGIGSSSKAFTAATVAMLVDSQKVSLDAPAARYLPDFQLFDPYASREITVRDLLSHRSGLARGELAWYGSGFDRDEILHRVRFLQPTWSFRSQFGYQNIMYLAAGQVAAHVARKSWDDVVRDRIFLPLGMTSSSTSIRTIAGANDVATPHAEVSDTVRAITWRNIDNIAPAGSINSNVVDMAQWVRLHLNKGMFGGKRIISERMIDEMHSPQTVIRLDTASRRMNPYTHLQAYGLGWFLEDYRGRYVVHHGGNIDGFTALVGMMPEERFGVVILTNMNGTGLPTALLRRAFDLHLKAQPPRDWSADLHARVVAQRTRAREAQQRAVAQRTPNTKPSLALSAYAGTYADSLYGEVKITEANGTLTLTFGPNWKGELEHWHFDTFRVRFDTPVLGASMVQFALDPTAKVSQVTIDMAGAMTFRRVPEGRGRAAAPTP
jgi:CubicO group peptidase (beta-lactamase class C family)